MPKNNFLLAISALFFLMQLLIGKVAFAQNYEHFANNQQPIETEKVSQDETEWLAEISPKAAWPEFPKGKNVNSAGFNSNSSNESSSISARKIILWLPNRLVDLWDIFRVDVGVGPSLGFVVRASEYAQLGYREMNPASLRVGLLGRTAPIMLENSNELGFPTAFEQSKDREICKGEFGIGIDPIIAGAYAGICIDELYDFFSAFWGQDFKNDDF